MQKNKGITLIALVVTIVVLIILATISINVLFGEDGLIGKAQQAKDISNMTGIKEEAEMVKADVIIDNIGSTLTKSDLITALKEHFAGSTLENGRVVVENGKYDIVVKNNLDIVVVKHGESYLSENEIGITYEVEDVDAYTKTIKVYLEVAIKPYEEYAAEILAGIAGDEDEETKKEQMFIEANKYYMGDELPEEAKDITDFAEWMNFMATLGAFGEEEEIPTTIEDFKKYVNATYGWTYETVDDMLIYWGYIEPEQYETLYLYEEITVTCSNGETVTTNTDNLYAEFTVTENGTYTITAEAESGKYGETIVKIEVGEKFSQLYTETAKYVDNEKTAWIPAGFAVGVSKGINSIDTGLVITDSVDSNGYSNGNEFVWVPVDEISDIYDEANNAGQLWSFSGTTSSKQAYPSTPNSGRHEPDVVTYASSGKNSASGSKYDAVSTNLQQAGFTSDLNEDGTVNAYDFKIELQNEFNSMIASVREYGGFYIGRYETGNLSKAKAVVQKENTDIANQTWYTMYAKCKTIEEGKGSVTSSMIWGSLWDATLRWMQTSTDTEVAKFPTDSTGKGNYYGTNGNAPIPTGSNPNYSVNNIYDMAGNVYDWTLEVNFGYRRIARGGDCVYRTTDETASNLGGDVPTYSLSYEGCRSYLYVTLGANSD